MRRPESILAQWLDLNSKAMAPMPIHTVATDKEEYVRIIGGFADFADNEYIGEVGIVNAYARDHAPPLIFVSIGEAHTVFNQANIEYITKKEYFKGCLGG